MADVIKHYRQLLGIAKSWAIQNIAGWSVDTHRDLIAKHGAQQIDGRVTATSMNMPQLAAALEDYERRGWPRQKGYAEKDEATKGQPRKAVPARISKIVKLWGKLGTAAKVNNANRQALLAFCARQVQREVPNLDALSVKECQAITEALKSWFNRD